MKMTFLIFVVTTLYCGTTLFAQPEERSRKFSAKISQSLVYSNNLTKTEINKFSYSPSISLEYKFLKNYLSTFIGAEYYKNVNNYKYYQGLIRTLYPIENPDTTEHFIIGQSELSTINLLFGFNTYFLGNKYMFQPYFSFGTLLKFTFRKTENTDCNITTHKITEESEINPFSITKVKDKIIGFNSFFFSIGTDLNLKNNFKLNFEFKCTAYHISLSYTSTLGLKYEF